MKLFIQWLLVFSGLASLSAQQTYNIKGKVIDFHDKIPLQNTKIKIGDYSAFTNLKGDFQIYSVPEGSYILTASHPDCETFSETITVDRDLEMTLNLEHDLEEIETVTIHGVHKNNASLIMKTLDKTAIQRNSTENLGNVLSSISGVSSLKTGNNIAKPVIHGLYGSRVLLINDGVKMAEQEWGVEHAPNVDINNFEHIDVIKGASALKYGSDAIGGVIVMEPEVFPKKDSLQGAANLSGISNGRGLAFDLNLVKTFENGLAIKTHGGFKKLGDLYSPDYHLMNTGLQNNSFAFTVQKNSFLEGFSFDYRLINQEIGIYRGSDLGNLEDFYYALTTQTPIYQRDFSYAIDNPKQEVEHHIAKISAFRRFSDWGKISATYSFQYNHRKEFDVRRGELSQIPSLDLELFTNSFTLNDLIERPKWKLESGMDLMYQYNYSTPETQSRRLVPNYTKYTGGIYSIFNYKFNSVFNAEIGVRYDVSKLNVKKWYDLNQWENLYATQFPEYYVRTDQNRVFTNPILNYQNFSFNAGVEFKPSKQFDLKINYAKVGRTPNIAELFADGLHHSAAIIEVGDLAIKNEIGHQFNLNVDSKINFLHGLQISINPYFFLTKNFITEVPTGIQNTIRGVFPVWSYLQVDAEMYGLDFDAHLKFDKNFMYTGKFSYVHGDDKTHNQPLILMMPPHFSNAIEFTESTWKNMYLKIENRTFLQQKRFPVYNPTISIFENGEQVEKTLDLSTPPPSYSIWNLQTGLSFNQHFSAGLQVNNLFNINYKDYLNRLRFFSYEMGRNFILNIKYNF